MDINVQCKPSMWRTEDLCALLGLRPAAKYDTTWDRIAKIVRDRAMGLARHAVFHGLLEACGIVPSSIRHQLGSRRCTARCA